MKIKELAEVLGNMCSVCYNGNVGCYSCGQEVCILSYGDNCPFKRDDGTTIRCAGCDNSKEWEDFLSKYFTEIDKP